jgi:L-ascorbate metabolism protein UlaG (beta-lactamase superfamily)
MRIRWLGWAGIEVEEQGEHVVVDPLQDPAAVFAWVGGGAAQIPLPAIVAPRPGAIAGMLTHLHRDHADANALKWALASDARVHEPHGYGGNSAEQLAVAQAEEELSAAGLRRNSMPPWSRAREGAFTLTALPAVDGTGDPQVSWLIEAGGKRILHLGDTTFHGWWRRFRARFGVADAVFAPINGPRLTFPHRSPSSPLPGAMDPEQAALAAELLQAERLVPIHYGGYELPGIYEPVPDALERLSVASTRVSVLAPGESIEL